MQLNRFFASLKRNWFTFSIAALSFILFPWIKYWNDHPFMSDVDQYYSYLVALFIHNDLGFHFPNGFWLHTGPIGMYVQKMSIGVAYMYAPFFLLGDLIAKIFGFATDGYSAPYAYSIAFGTILYVLIGLHYLRKSLLYFFATPIVNLTIISIYFGTNLLFYTVGWGLMSHSYLFFLMAMVIYCTLRWYQDHLMKHILLAGLLLGIICVARPIEGLFLLFPVLFGVTRIGHIKERFLEIWQYRVQFFLAAVLFAIPIIPQLMYWKIFTGSWLYFSYHDEGFFFSDPKVFEVLFSFRKGLLVYSPILILSFIGLFYSRKQTYFLGLISFLVLNIYLVSAWWCWWYGGSFGMRALVQSFALLAFPFAQFLSRIWAYEKLKKGVFGFLVLAIVLNLTQTYQFSHNTIHWDAMTSKAYFHSLFNFSYNAEERAYFDSVLEEPDYDAAKLGARSLDDYRKPIPAPKLTEKLLLVDQTEKIVLSLNNQFAPSYNLIVKDFLEVNSVMNFQLKIHNPTEEEVHLAMVVDIFDGENRVNYISKEIVIESKAEETINHSIPIEGFTNDSNTVKSYVYIPKGNGLEITKYRMAVLGR